MSRARITIQAETLEEAEPKARDAFASYFGNDSFEITDDEASAVLSGSGDVLSWSITFTAEGVAGANETNPLREVSDEELLKMIRKTLKTAEERQKLAEELAESS